MKLNPRELCILKFAAFSLLSLILVLAKMDNVIISFVFYFAILILICKINDILETAMAEIKKCTRCKYKDTCESVINKSEFARKFAHCKHWRWDKE